MHVLLVHVPQLDIAPRIHLHHTTSQFVTDDSDPLSLVLLSNPNISFLQSLVPV